MVKSCVLEVLNLTKLRVSYSEMLCKSELIVEDIARGDWEWVLEEGWHWKEEDLCRVESSAKAWTSEAEAWRRSFIKRRERERERERESRWKDRTLKNTTGDHEGCRGFTVYNNK